MRRIFVSLVFLLSVASNVYAGCDVFLENIDVCNSVKERCYADEIESIDTCGNNWTSCMSKTESSYQTCLRLERARQQQFEQQRPNYNYRDRT